MEQFEQLFSKHKDHYVYLNGMAKFETIKSKVITSPKIALLNSSSVDRRISPTVKDLGMHISSIGYFMLCKSETSAIAEFIALKNWNDKVNKLYTLSTEVEVLHKANYILQKWGIRLR
ncbi:MAG: hypothetical protein EOO85_10150 [Pedobacter sp.]|nr:MAG: hypothetical protein EOO85_10150 [Pedobacter sp.]